MEAKGSIMLDTLRRRWSERRDRRLSIRLLQKQIKKIDDEYGYAYLPSVDGDFPRMEDRQVAFKVWTTMMEPLRNALTWQRQRPLIDKLQASPIEVPDEYWINNNGGLYLPVLSLKGEIWVRHELDKITKAKIEFWLKLVMPVVSFIISIIALFRSWHSH